jgi:hypothetical protein
LFNYLSGQRERKEGIIAEATSPTWAELISKSSEDNVIGFKERENGQLEEIDIHF